VATTATGPFSCNERLVDGIHKKKGSVPTTGVEPFCLYGTFLDLTGLRSNPVWSGNRNQPINEERGEPQL